MVDSFHLERVNLLGSYAYGVPEPNSDVDLLVVLTFEAHPANDRIGGAGASFQLGSRDLRGCKGGLLAL